MLGKIINHKVCKAVIGEGKNEIEGLTLFNPTIETYLNLGFTELPTAKPQTGFHDEYRVDTRKIQKNVLVDIEYSSEIQNGERVTIPHEIYETREVDEEYITAVAVADEPKADIARYSKLKIVDALIDKGIWAQVKAMIQADENMWDRFIQAQDFSSDYVYFMLMVVAIKQAFPSLDVDAILENARI